MQEKQDITYDEFVRLYTDKFMNLVAESGLSGSELHYKSGLSVTTCSRILKNDIDNVKAKTIYDAYVKLKSNIQDK